MNFVFIFLFVGASIWIQQYISKYPDKRLSRIFSPKHGLRNQTRKELVEQIIFSFAGMFIALVIFTAVAYVASLIKDSNSLAIIAIPLLAIAFILGVFGAMCAVMLPFAKRKKDV